jgi:hypothetical protein
MLPQCGNALLAGVALIEPAAAAPRALLPAPGPHALGISRRLQRVRVINRLQKDASTGG